MRPDIYNLPDHPVIRNMEMTGYPNGSEPEYPHCPVCSAECDEVYKAKDGTIVGCDMCLQRLNAWQCDSCFQE